MSDASSSQQQQQRVVILPGPHKTGTTSVQSFLASLTKKGLLGNWEWPAGSSKGFSDVAHSIFFDADDKHGVRRRKHSKIQAAWKRQHNIVFGAELFDYVGAAPPQDLPSVFERLYSVLPQDAHNNITAVVMYRTPRSSHLVSAWKQQLAMVARGKKSAPAVWRTTIQKGLEAKGDAPSLAEWLCTGKWQGRMEFHVDKILAAQLAPMAVANAFARYGHTHVVVGDMSNMKDISSTIACEVLQVPCTADGKVVGDNKTTKVLNKRSNPAALGFSDGEMSEIEEVLRRMDCFHYCDLRTNLTILHANDSMLVNPEGWNNCCTTPETFLTPKQALEKLQHIGCHTSGLRQVEGLQHQNNNATKVSAPPRHKDLVELKLDDAMNVHESSMVLPCFMMACNLLVAFLLLMRFQKRRRTK